MIIKEKRGVTPDSVMSGGQFEVDIGTYGTAVGIEVCRVTVQRTDGDATTFAFSIGNRDGFSTATIHEKYLSATTASTAMLDETDIAGFMMTSDTGRLYFKITVDGGTNNVFSYSVMYRR